MQELEAAKTAGNAEKIAEAEKAAEQAKADATREAAEAEAAKAKAEAEVAEAKEAAAKAEAETAKRAEEAAALEVQHDGAPAMVVFLELSGVGKEGLDASRFVEGYARLLGVKAERLTVSRVRTKVLVSI